MKRTLKRILSTVLVAVMLIGIAPMGGIDLAPKASAKDISSYSVGDTITYGSYPQSKVTNSNLIAKIKAAGEKYAWCDYNYYAGTGSWSDGNMKPVDNMMLYKDIPYGGNKYRAVKINQYRPYYTGNTSSSSNSEQDDNGYYTGNVYYFKYEPLTWRVLDPSEGYVMCNQIIDSQAYQSFIYYNGSEYYNSKGCANYASDWVTSSLRQWLNNSFYNTAFSAEEKSQIGTSHLENKSKHSSTYDSADTYDKIFPISYYDAINSAYGFNSDRRAYDTARQLKGTDYAKCQGLCYGGTSWWWLRSPFDSYYVSVVNYDGWAYYSYIVYNTDLGVIPAFKFNPKSTIPESKPFKMTNSEVAMKCDFEYTDAFFDQSSYIYNHKLAIASCCFATSAMVKDGAPFNNPESAENMLNAIGFGNNGGEAVSCYGYQKSPTMNSIACVVSNKNIGDTSIIAVAVRGGGYEGEWAGNFNVGTDTNHAGFDVAKQQVCDNIIKFMNQDGITLNKNVKFWITGYSRAAATANLVAADVNNKKLVAVPAQAGAGVIKSAEKTKIAKSFCDGENAFKKGDEIIISNALSKQLGQKLSELEKCAEEGKAFRRNLTKQAIKYSSLCLGKADGEIIKKMCDSLDIDSLKSFTESLISKASEVIPLKPQLEMREDAHDFNNNEFIF